MDFKIFLHKVAESVLVFFSSMIIANICAYMLTGRGFGELIDIAFDWISDPLPKPQRPRRAQYSPPKRMTNFKSSYTTCLSAKSHKPLIYQRIVSADVARKEIRARMKARLDKLLEEVFAEERKSFLPTVIANKFSDLVDGMLDEILKGYSDSEILEIYRHLKSHPDYQDRAFDIIEKRNLKEALRHAFRKTISDPLTPLGYTELIHVPGSLAKIWDKGPNALWKAPKLGNMRALEFIHTLIELDGERIRELLTFPEEARSLLDASEAAAQAFLRYKKLNEMFKYQTAAAVWINHIARLGSIGWYYPRNRFLLCDTMGLGKTITSLGAYAMYDLMQQKKSNTTIRLTIVCPSPLKEQWRQAITEWLTEIAIDRGIAIAENLEAAKQIFLRRNAIMSYDAFTYAVNNSTHWKELLRGNFIIFDEAHYLRGDSERTKAYLKLLRALETTKDSFVLLLTGTPIMNKKEEYLIILGYTHIKSDILRNENAFRMLVLSTSMRRTYEKVRQSEWIPRKNRFFYMGYKTKERHEWRYYPMDETGWVVAHNTYIDQLKIRLKRIVPITQEEIYRQKGLIISRIIIEGDPVEPKGNKLNPYYERALVFVKYKNVIDIIKEELKSELPHWDIYVITGELNTDQRSELVERFKQNKYQILIATIDSFGYGFNVPEADVVFFVQLDWSPASIKQAEDRAYRLTRAKNLDIYYLTHLQEEQDYRFLRILRKKEELMIENLVEEVNTK